MRAVFFLSISNLLPDLYFFTLLRPLFWKMAGVKINFLGKTLIRKNVWIDFPKNLEVHDECYFNRGIILSAQEKIVIEKNVRIGFNVGVHTVYHENKKDGSEDKALPITLKTGSQIYTNSIILPGTIIGQNCDVIAGSVVNGIIEDNAVVGGNPARIIKIRD
tara:strand:- start:894 stop:1379 length:486 start_codon:yes stop_codon:yes gene_type:complete